MAGEIGSSACGLNRAFPHDTDRRVVIAELHLDDRRQAIRRNRGVCIQPRLKVAIFGDTPVLDDVALRWCHLFVRILLNG